ncbi:MAG TPA: tetratricopeptide repeat protein [Vicinamibacteria bacterium]|nr:tetratricopeptide repeat protein [Vicinamibacteria bacterium]
MARAAAALSLLLAGAAWGQTSPESQAKGLLEDGRGYMAKKQYKQALDNFNTIVTGFGQTNSVDDALLEIGRYRLEVDDDVEKAREAFDQVAKRYPQSDGAPGAYYYLGLLALNRALQPAELDDALAQFTRVQRLYPRSEWVPRALYASGLAHRKAGRYAEAVEAERRVSLEHPTSDVAPAAQFQIGHSLALQGASREAMEEFQQVRNRFPDSPWAETALQRTTALYRLHGSGKPVFSVDGTFALAAGEALKDVRALLMTPDRTLWLASNKVKSALAFARDGSRGASLTVEEPRSLSLGPRGEIVVSAKMAVRIGPRDIKSFAAPTDKPGVLEPLEKIEAAVVTPLGSVLVADSKRKRVYKYQTAELSFGGTFPDAREREVIRLLADGEGGIVLLDADAKAVLVFDEAGKPLRGLAARGAGYELKKPVDVAVDPFRNLYVADAELGVLVFAPSGQLLATIAAPEARRPRAVALDVEGAVLVYDERSERVVRFQ